MKRTSLGALHEARGAHWIEHFGWQIPGRFAAVADEYLALQEGAGLLDLSHRQLLRITGRDRRSWLHGQVTQEVNALPDGRGAYSTIMTPQGKLVSDLRIFALPDALWLDAPAGTAQPLAEYLERFLIMERAEIEDLTDRWALLSLQGPLAPCAIACLFGQEARHMERWAVQSLTFQGETALVTRSEQCGEDGYDIFVPAGPAPALWAALSQSRRSFAVHSVGWEAFNLRRVEAGIPWWGAELDSTLMPLEARLDRAISLHKGCYVGQEIVARIDARGHVNNLLAGFLVHGAAPAFGALVLREGRRVGRIASVVHSPRLNRLVALGFLRRELQENGARFPVEGGGEVEVTALPFVPDDFPSTADCASCE
jgi:folate-binding protein YgfZ